jgi:uncharacterized protein (DUF302 family)
MADSYGMTKTTSLSPAAAEAAVRQSLADAGFGILTEIDVAATLKAKLDLDRTPYTILGACNPSLAAQALDAEESVGLLLPCNVVVYERDGSTVVAALEPLTMVDLTGNEELAEIAAEAKRLLTKALDAVPA